MIPCAKCHKNPANGHPWDENGIPTRLVCDECYEGILECYAEYLRDIREDGRWDPDQETEESED